MHPVLLAKSGIVVGLSAVTHLQAVLVPNQLLHFVFQSEGAVCFVHHVQLAVNGVTLGPSAVIFVQGV